jgi:hypothetical protein
MPTAACGRYTGDGWHASSTALIGEISHARSSDQISVCAVQGHTQRESLTGGHRVLGLPPTSQAQDILALTARQGDHATAHGYSSLSATATLAAEHESSGATALEQTSEQCASYVTGCVCLLGHSVDSALVLICHQYVMPTWHGGIRLQSCRQQPAERFLARGLHRLERGVLWMFSCSSLKENAQKKDTDNFLVTVGDDP